MAHEKILEKKFFTEIVFNVIFIKCEVPPRLVRFWFQDLDDIV